MTQEWGVVDGMLSVVVRTPPTAPCAAPTAVVTARDRNDVLISSSLEAPDGVLLPVADLPPGQEFGFYVDVGDAAADDQPGRRRLPRRRRGRRPTTSPPNPLEAQPVRLDGNGQGAVVVAKVRTSASRWSRRPACRPS